MKKIFLVYFLFISLQAFSQPNNWIKILDSDSSGIIRFKEFKYITIAKKDIYIQYGAPGSSDTTSQDRYYSWSRYNKNNGTWDLYSHNSFIFSYPAFCPWPNINQYLYYDVSNFWISHTDTSLIFEVREFTPCSPGPIIEPAQDSRITYNSGQTYTTLTRFGNGALGNACSGFDFDPLKDSVMYIGYPDTQTWAPTIWKSTNRGINWFAASVFANLSTGGIIKVYPLNRNIIFATTSSGMIKSTNGGSNFYSISMGTFSDIYFDLSDSSLYALWNRYGGTHGIYKSTDKGDNWILKISGDFNVLEIDPDNHNIVYAGASTGLYRSINGGTSWNLYNNSFENSNNIIGISKDPGSLDTLFAVTSKAVYKIWGQRVITIDTNSLKYLPLAIGNKWVYYLVNTFPPTSGYFSVQIQKDTLFNGHIYFYFSVIDILEGWVRVDSSNGNVYTYPGTPLCNLHPIENLNDSLASKYHDIFYHCDPVLTNARVCDDTSSFILGSQNFISKGFNDTASLTATFNKYSKNIGLVYAVRGENFQRYYYLKGCVINGTIYGDTTIYYISFRNRSLPG